jgi:hypothetical protein
MSSNTPTSESTSESTPTSSSTSTAIHSPTASIVIDEQHNKRKRDESLSLNKQPSVKVAKTSTSDQPKTKIKTKTKPKPQSHPTTATTTTSSTNKPKSKPTTTTSPKPKPKHKPQTNTSQSFILSIQTQQQVAKQYQAIAESTIQQIEQKIACHSKEVEKFDNIINKYNQLKNQSLASIAAFQQELPLAQKALDAVVDHNNKLAMSNSTLQHLLMNKSQVQEVPTTHQQQNESPVEIKINLVSEDIKSLQNTLAESEDQTFNLPAKFMLTTQGTSFQGSGQFQYDLNQIMVKCNNAFVTIQFTISCSHFLAMLATKESNIVCHNMIIGNHQYTSVNFKCVYNNNQLTCSSL